MLVCQKVTSLPPSGHIPSNRQQTLFSPRPFLAKKQMSQSVTSIQLECLRQPKSHLVFHLPTITRDSTTSRPSHLPLRRCKLLASLRFKEVAEPVSMSFRRARKAPDLYRWTKREAPFADGFGTSKGAPKVSFARWNSDEENPSRFGRRWTGHGEPPDRQISGSHVRLSSLLRVVYVAVRCALG